MKFYSRHLAHEARLKVFARAHSHAEPNESVAQLCILGYTPKLWCLPGAGIAPVLTLQLLRDIFCLPILDWADAASSPGWIRISS